MEKKIISQKKQLPLSIPLWAAIFIIVAAGLMVYGTSFKGQFIWDDVFLINDNPLIKDMSGIKDLLTTNIGAGAGRIFQPYRPLQMITYAMDFFLWGVSPLGYHLTNVLLHCLTGCAIFFLFRHMSGNDRIGLFTALLFVVHPVHSEAVAYISGRADSLSAFFMITALFFYIRSVVEGEMTVYIFLPFFYTLAIFSRESALIFPLVLLVYHAAFRVRIRILPLIPIVLIAAFFLFMRHMALEAFTFKTLGIPFTQRLTGSFAALYEYIRLILFPFNLHMGYGNPVFHIWHAKVIAGGIILAVTYAAYRYVNNEKDMVRFCLLWFFVTLLPQANIFMPMTDYMAEHWLYVPSIGLFAIAATGLVRFMNDRPGGRSVGYSVLVIVLLYFSVLTIRQNNYWSDPVTFYQMSVKASPKNPKIHFNAGNLLFDKGNIDNAIVEYSKAVELQPKFAAAYYNLSMAYYNKGELDLAKLNLKKAEDLGYQVDPDYKVMLENL